MKFKDKIRYLYAKIIRKKTLLFSSQDSWEWALKKRILGYVPFFYDFDEINPNDFDVIMPLTLPAQRYINTNRKLFFNRIYISPSDYCIELCNDKAKFNDYLSKNGFQKLLPAIDEKFNYPYILKKKVGAWGVGTYIISSIKNEIEHKDKIESKEYFTQKYIEGKYEYAAHIIIVDKKIVFFKALKSTFHDEYFIKGRDFKPKSIEEIDHEKYKSIFEEILSRMGYEGICCFNYKITEEGLSIFELNPRFGATLNRFINEALICYSTYGKLNKKIHLDKIKA